MSRKNLFSKAVISLWVVVILTAILFLLGAFGCSAVQEISSQTQTIDDLAQSSESRFVKIADISEVDEVEVEAKHGIVEQQSIQNSVSEIRQALPRVENKTPSWMTIFERLSFVGILIAVIILIWQTGIGTLIRRLLYSMSLFIPRKSRRDAEMDLKIADSDDKMTIREAIASKRSSDPAYNSAYTKLTRGK